jgi:hypothetical protein
VISPVLDPEGDHADRAVAAHGQAPAGFYEEYPAVAIGLRGRIEEPAGHHVVPPRLEHQAGPDPVEPRKKILPPRTHARAVEHRRPARDEADGITGRVSVDAEEGVTHGVQIRRLFGVFR